MYHNDEPKICTPSPDSVPKSDNYPREPSGCGIIPQKIIDSNICQHDDINPIEHIRIVSDV